MSKVKIVAARELIEEKNYSVARQLLQTIDDPVAARWLAQLDRIAPASAPLPPPSGYYAPPSQQLAPYPPPAYRLSPEQEKFYRNENRAHRRRRVFNGIELVFIGIAALVFFAFLNLPSPTGRSNTIDIWELVVLALALFCILVGLGRIFRRDQ